MWRNFGQFSFLSEWMESIRYIIMICKFIEHGRIKLIFWVISVCFTICGGRQPPAMLLAGFILLVKIYEGLVDGDNATTWDDIGSPSKSSQQPMFIVKS